MKIGKEDALICVDVQNDFCIGSLAVKGALSIIDVLNKYLELFSKAGSVIIATRDWHPPDHCSFKHRGGIWPEHCVQNTEGAGFYNKLKLPSNTIVISKGFEKEKEAYSGFEGVSKDKSLEEVLKAGNVKRVFVGGLATDYCVKATALDATKRGFETYFLEDASKGVDANPGDVVKAIKEMETYGIKKIKISDLKL